MVLTQSQRNQVKSVRLEKLALAQLSPDPLQARRLFPQDAYQRLYRQQVSPSRILHDWVLHINSMTRQKQQRCENPFDWVQQVEKEQLEAEALVLYDLTHLALSLEQEGQVMPLTVVERQGCYRIETGERRYWAGCLLKHFKPDTTYDGQLLCHVLATGEVSPFRQAYENTQRSRLTAMGMARQLALLLLYVHGYEMPEAPVGMSFYRQALPLTLYNKRDYTALIYNALGGLNKKQFHMYKMLLNLHDEAAEMADRYDIEVGLLHYVAYFNDFEDQVELIRLIQSKTLKRKDLRALKKSQKAEGFAGGTFSTETEMPKNPAMPLARWTVSCADLLEAELVAEAFVMLSNDTTVAKKHMSALRQMLADAEQRLEIP